MNILPIDLTLSIYGAHANRSDTKGIREKLSKRLMKIFIKGKKDEHRVTLHGPSYLHHLNQELDPGN